MAKNIFFWSFALFLIVQSLFISAFDCNSMPHDIIDTCIQIQESDLIDEEKNALISNLDYNGKSFPDHEHVYQRNTNLLISDAPLEVEKQNSEYIKDAWLSIFSIMPSVLYNKSLYVPENIEVLSGFNYKIEIPQDYYSKHYPSTDKGDCKRIYTLIKNTSEARIYINNNYQDSGRLVPAAIDSDSEIKVEYDISVSVKIDHYKWRSYCCRRSSSGRCIKYCHYCKYRNSETIKDSIHITNSLNVKYYDNKLFADIEVIDSYSSTKKIAINYSNSARLDFQDSSYEFNQYAYDIAYSKEPYYAYTLRAEDYDQESMSNMLKDGNSMLVKNTDGCRIRAFDFFKTIEKACNAEYDGINFSINTDKLKYKLGETINVQIYPADVPTRISYDGEIKDAIGTTSFTAKPLKNKITAYYSSLQAESIIYVTDKERFAIAYNISIFGLVNYLLYTLLRKFWGEL